MLVEIFKNILILSIVGAFFILILLIIKPLTKKVFGAAWQYYIWIASLSFFIIPIKFKPAVLSISMQRAQGYNNPRNVVVYSVGQILEETEKVATSFPDLLKILSIVWILVAIAIFLVKVSNYCCFIKTLKNNSYLVENKYNLSEKVAIRKTAVLVTPLLAGVFKPCIYHPETDEKKMALVISHELTHLKRKDIIVKWISTIVCCLHWFNPAVYLLHKQINQECEISCDCKTTEKMTDEEKNNYMSIILEMMSYRTNPSFLSHLSNEKRIIKKRFLAIKYNKKYSTVTKILSIAFAILIILVGCFSSGAVAAVLGEKAKPEISLKDIEQFFEYKPAKFPRENENKLPVTNVGLPKESNQEKVETEIVFEQEEIKIESVQTEAEETDYYMGDLHIQQLTKSSTVDEILNSTCKIKNSLKTVELNENYVIKAYNSNEKILYSVNVKPDENGNIRLFFDAEENRTLARVTICEQEKQGQGWAYYLNTDNNSIYVFLGFEPEKTYTVEIDPYCPGRYDIDGKILIF